MPNYTLDIFKTTPIPYSWATLYVGRQLHILDWKQLERYAIEYLEQNPACNDPSISELAYGVKEIESDELLVAIVRSINSTMEKDGPIWNLEKRKWRYCLLQELKFLLPDPFNFSQQYRIIYADFGYPEDMWDFLYKISPDDNYTDSIENNIKIDERKLDIFLEKEKKKINEKSPDWPLSDYYPPIESQCKL